LTAAFARHRKPAVGTLIHPNDALLSDEKRFPIINACEHSAGSEKLITKALEGLTGETLPAEAEPRWFN